MAKYDRTTLNVCAKQCDQCLFGKNKIVSDERKAEILKTAKNFTCHKASIAGKQIMCRGFYEANKNTSPLIVIGHYVNVVKFVEP